MPTQEYDDSLKTPQWAAKRKQVRARCDNLCERCHSQPMVHTHHQHYRNLGNEPLDDLQGLCADCHARTG